MCGRYSLFFDDEYDHDISEMMKLIKKEYAQTDVKPG